MNAASTGTVTGEVRADRRQQLIDAAIEAIAGNGLSRVTLAKVASHAGLSPGIVNFYFQSKEQLLLATLHSLAAEYEQRIDQALGTATGPEEALRAIIDVNLDPKICNPHKASVWYAFWGESQARSDYLRVFGRREAEMLARIDSLFAELCRESTIPSIDPAAVAKAFDALIDCFWEDCMANPGGFDREAARATCLSYLRSLFPDRFAEPRPAPAAAGHTMLASWTYRNAELFELEQENLFRRHWLLAAHLSDLARRGDYVTFEAAGERALVIRGDDGELRAFHNVCRHRGSRLVAGRSGNCPRALVCPFHGWTYGLDGCLKNVPRLDTFPGLDRSRHGLVPVELEVWQGFVFVRFRPGGPSLAQTMAPVEDLVSPYRLAEVVPAGPLDRTQYPYNWKIIHDVDNEGYHVPMAHPGLQALYGRSYRDILVDGIPYSDGVVDDRPARRWSVARYKKLLPSFDHLPEDRQRLWCYVGIFPNLVLALYPDMMEFYMTLPLAVDRTVMVSRSFALPDERREVRAVRYLNRRINTATDREDRDLCRWLQEASHSSVFPVDMLSTLEHGVLAFQQRIQEEIPVASLDAAPAAGSVARINASLAGR